MSQSEFEMKSERDWIEELKGAYTKVVSKDPEMRGSSGQTRLIGSLSASDFDIGLMKGFPS